jgi:hypothetical protein
LRVRRNTNTDEVSFMRTNIGTLDSVGVRSYDRGGLIALSAMPLPYPTFVVPAVEAVTP